MKCLTDREVSAWLEEHGIPERPYEGREAPVHYLQLHAPGSYPRLEALIQAIHCRLAPGAGWLIQIEDWAHYTPSQLIAVQGIRALAGESRLLIDSPGHLIGPDEADTAISLSSLCAAFGWSAYTYSSLARTTLYNWEGEIFDFWTDCAELYAEMKSIVAEFSLEIISISPE
jgi:hypothetical protein